MAAAFILLTCSALTSEHENRTRLCADPGVQATVSRTLPVEIVVKGQQVAAVIDEMPAS